MVKRKNPNGIPSSIHKRTITENANTNGCTGVSAQDLKDLTKFSTILLGILGILFKILYPLVYTPTSS